VAYLVEITDNCVGELGNQTSNYFVHRTIPKDHLHNNDLTKNKTENNLKINLLGLYFIPLNVSISVAHQ
jgi:hypothetical protein